MTPESDQEPSPLEPYKPPGYSTDVPSRASLLIAMGIAGILCSLLSIWGMYSTVFICICLPGPAVACCFSVPTWMMSTSDLDRIRAGVMNSDGVIGTRAGIILGMFGTLLAIISLGVLILRISGLG